MKRVVLYASAAVLSIGAIVGVNYGVFSFVCTEHDWSTFWRWLFRAGCI